MNFLETEEQVMLRRAIAEIAGDFGHDWYADHGHREEKVDAIWEDPASGGFSAVNIPEQFGGGGIGIYELAIVCEEPAAAGLLNLVASHWLELPRSYG